ncbi:3-oxoacyl-ACP synthase [Arenimonas terrae]|uniref:3-oxoacyl-ACP synthase n=2 Tax=Arenimonas terrae TaxID=2546226 RepID=A0A5C4RYQ5_9GAMM|nr:3-oxoacyl-ACP synthase [Arenimonas terrae]
MTAIVNNQFSVRAWSAFAPGLESAEDWRAWAAHPRLPQGDDAPALVEMPAMQRRRLERLGRMALQVAWRCQPDTAAALPLVFASRHGDISRTFEMLTGLARGEPLSPTHFGLSTHNAIAAQYSIARGLTGNYLAVSASPEAAEAAVVEALALIADGAPEVLVVVYDGPVPADYAEYRDEPEAFYAWAWRIGPPRADLPTYSLEPGDGVAAPSGLPHGLDVLRFFLSDETRLRAPQSGRCWRRHA